MAGKFGCFKRQNSDGAAMASGSPDVMTSQEPAEVQEECSGKKKSRFQTFKMFFARKKRKEPQTTEGEGGLKASQSSDNVSETSENNTLTRSEKERGSGSKISLGNKALSHDSVFVSDSSEATEGLGASQDSIHGKVKSLQLQLKQAIRLGSPPSLMCVKKTEDAGTMSEDDGLPCSPPEYTSHRTELTRTQRNGSNSLLAVDSDDEKRSGATSSRAVSPLVVPGDFSQPASPFGCLDNSAAKHKLGLRHKAYNKRKPANKLELNAEEDSRPEETITIFVPGAGTMEQQVKGESGDQLEPKVEREKEEEEEEEGQDFTEDEEDEEEEEEAAQEASHALDTSCVLEPRVSEDEVSDDQPLTSSADSSRVSPEPPAVLRDSSPAGVSCGAEDSDSISEGEDVVQRSNEVASSFLEEVLSSLKTPLSSHVADEETEGVVVEMKEETKEEQNKEVETDQSVEMMEEEEEVEEPVGCQDASFSSVLSDQTHEEEEEELPNTYSLEEEDVEMGEKAESREEDEVVEQLTKHDGEQDECEEENHALQNHSEAQWEEEEGGAAEVMEEKPELEEMLEVNQAEYNEEEEEGVEENEGRDVEENEEEERGVVEEMGEMISDSQDEEDPRISSVQEAEGDEGGDDSASTNGEIAPEMSDQGVVIGREGQKDLNQNSEDEREDEEEEAEFTEPTSEEEEVTQPDEAREDLEQEHEEIISSTMKPAQDPEEAAEQTMVSSRPPSLSPPESHPESHPDSPSEKGPVSPSSKTTTVHINLASPSSEKSTYPFQLSPVAADPSESVCESPRPPDRDSTRSSPPEEDQGRSVWGGDDLCPASVQEVVPQPADQSKVRFTIAPAWQRSQSLTSSSTGHVSPPPPVSEPKGDDEDSTAETPSAGSPQTSAAATTPESSVVVEGNPENPFGVRLRKTSALRRFSSEEETLEAPGEAQVQPVGVKVDSAQTPLCPPPNNKPAVPKKPEVHGDAGGKLRRISEPAAGRGGPGGSDPPSWISMAKQKQKVYKENSLDEITVKKEEQERKSSLPVSVSREHSNKAKGGPSVTSTPSAFVEKETRKVFSPPTPVPPQPLKSQLLLVTPKPQAPPPTSKPPPQTNSPQMPPPPATPIHISLKSPPSTTPSQISITATTTDTPVVTSPPFSSRTFPERPVLRAPELPLQAAFPPRSPPSPALPHDEPPWMALAKKKAKAWSEMPQIVQ